MKVAILGCGPAGLLAAHAVQLTGHQPTIFSKRVRSDMPGAMYMHERIPELTGDDPDALINYQKLGTKQGYAKKVYGNPDAPCSWDLFPEGAQPAWDMAQAYGRLWERFGDEIVDLDVTPEVLGNGLQQGYDKVISSIPAVALCYGDCLFYQQSIWVHRTHRDICEQLGDPCVVYNGQEQDDVPPYYRTSLIFGAGSTEFANPQAAAMYDCVAGVKPLGTTCKCRPNIMRIGRFGQWRKGVLVHHAFQEVLDALH